MPYIPKGATPVHLALLRPIVFLAVIGVVVVGGMKWWGQPKPVISINFDDGYYSQVAYGSKILDEFGMKATIFPVIDTIGEEKYASWQDLDRLAGNGWEIGAHSISHPYLSELSTGDKIREIVGSKGMLEDRGFEVKTFTMPYSEADEESWRYVFEHYEKSRTEGTEHLNYRPFIAHYLNSFMVKADTTIEEVKTLIDECIEKKAWLILVFHRINEEGEWSVTDNFLWEVCNYIDQQNRVLVRPMK